MLQTHLYNRMVASRPAPPRMAATRLAELWLAAPLNAPIGEVELPVLLHAATTGDPEAPAAFTVAVTHPVA